jgi:uncharacterized OsmC-like protein
METLTQVNGVNTEQLFSTIKAIQDNPSLAKFNFRAKTNWIEGGHSRTEIKSFYGANQEDTTRTKKFILEGDEPPVLLGSNKGPNAVELILAGLASCLAVGFSYNAAAKNLQIDSMEFSLDGNIDLLGFLGLSKEVRPGYNNINLTVKIKSDASSEQLEELSDYVQKTSPVLDIIKNPVPVSIEIEKI